jgi:hypothetical protein
VSDLAVQDQHVAAAHVPVLEHSIQGELELITCRCWIVHISLFLQFHWKF